MDSRGKVNKIKRIHSVTFYESYNLNLIENHRSMWNILTSFNVNVFQKAFNISRVDKMNKQFGSF